MSGSDTPADKTLQNLFAAHDAVREAKNEPMSMDAKESIEEAEEILEGMIQEEVA